MPFLKKKVPSEASIQRGIVDWLRSGGVFVIKLQLIGFTGMPDLALFLPGGRLQLIEVKRPGGVLSKRQVYVFNVLKRLGHSVLVVFSKEEAIEELQKCPTLKEVLPRCLWSNVKSLRRAVGAQRTNVVPLTALRRARKPSRPVRKAV